MTLAFNLFLYLVFLLFLYYIVRCNYKLVFLYGMLAYQALANIPSLIYIEEGMFISEQGRAGYFVGATLIYVIYIIITFLVIFMTFSSLKNVKVFTPVFVYRSKSKDLSILLFIVIISLVILLYNASLSKLPLLDTSVTRFTFWENSKFPFLNKIFGNVSIFIPFSLGILYKKYRKTSIFLLLVYFGYNFLIGQKFSPIIEGFFSFFLPSILSSTKKLNFKKIFNKKVILSVLIVSVIVHAVIYKAYKENEPFAVIKIYDPNEAMFYRIFGLQGHLVWGSIETYIYKDEPHSYDVSDISYGMHHLMYKFAYNPKELDSFIDSGFSFTNGYPSILFMIFPWWLALLFHLFLVMTILSFMGWLLFEFIKKEAYVMAVLAYQLFNWTIYAFTMGYFYKLTPVMIFLAFYLVIIFYNNKIKGNKLTA